MLHRETGKRPLVFSSLVNEALRDIEPMAWDFVMNFAKDNDLQVAEACLLPEVSAVPRK